MTLVELLVVIAIIGVLVALVLPGVQAARESARRGQCLNNLRQLGVALNLHADRDGVYPAGCIGCRPVLNSDQPPAVLRYISWNVQLLPDLEADTLARKFDISLPSYYPTNRPVAATVIDTFLCPSTQEVELLSSQNVWKGAAFSDYGGVYGVEDFEGNNSAADPTDTQTLREESLGTLVYEDPIAPRQVTDGLSHTAAIAEVGVRRLSAETEWVNGSNLFAQEVSTPINGRVVLVNEIGSPHPGGASLVFCDAHADFVADSIDQAVLNSLLTKAGDER